MPPRTFPHGNPGAYTSSSGGTKVSESTKMGKTDVTVYAHWSEAPTHTLRFDANEGYVSESSRPVREGEAYGTLPTPTRSGYDFDGWYTSRSGGTKVSSSTVMGTSDVTVYAHWSVKKVTYSVTYVSTNGTRLGSSTVSGAYGTTSTVNPPSFSGYDTPASQTVTFDSSGKTITFYYTPTPVSTSMTVKGVWFEQDGVKYVTYKCVIEIRNRTADSIEYRITWTNTKHRGYYGFTQECEVKCMGKTTGRLLICDNQAWASSSNQEMSKSVTSKWIKVTGLDPTATSLKFNGYGYSRDEHPKFEKNMTIPTF